MLANALEMSLFNLRHVYDLMRLMIETLVAIYVDLSTTTSTKDLINSSM